MIVSGIWDGRFIRLSFFFKLFMLFCCILEEAKLKDFDMLYPNLGGAKMFEPCILRSQQNISVAVYLCPMSTEVDPSINHWKYFVTFIDDVSWETKAVKKLSFTVLSFKTSHYTFTIYIFFNVKEMFLRICHWWW